MNGSTLGIIVLVLLVSCSLAVRLHKRENYEIPHDHPRAHAKLATQSIPLEGGFLILEGYFTTIKIGTPPVEIDLMIDTASSNVGIPAITCTNCGANAELFKPAGSSTFSTMSCTSSSCTKCTPDGTSCNNCGLFYGSSFCSINNSSACGLGVTYALGSSSISGYYGYDTVCLGSMCTTAVVSLIELEIPYGWLDGNYSGVLGLASEINACNPTCVPPLFDLYVQANLTSNLFSLCLNGANGGALDIGTIDSSRYTGSITYAPISLDRFYSITLLDIQVGSHSIGIPPFMYRTTKDVVGGTYVDSSTSLLILGDNIFAALKDVFFQYYSNLPGIYSLFSVTTTLSCARSANIVVANYPNVTFVVQSEDVTQPLYLSVPASSYLLPTFDKSQYCNGIASAQGAAVILGDVFMQNFYIVFDRTNLRLGFADVLSANCN